MDAPTKEKLDKLVAEIAKYSGIGDGSRYQHPLIAEMQVILAEEQSKSAAKMERFTLWLIVLTVVLTVFTAYLCIDAYHVHRQPQFNDQGSYQK